MHFVFDENVPIPFMQTLRGMGYQASHILDYLTEGAPDNLVAATCDSLGAVLLSSDRDFEAMISRRTDGQRPKFRNVHLVRMDCKDTRIGDRLVMTMPLIQKEYDLRKDMPDRRMIVWVRTDTIVVHR
jgi:predicted nuclease of predicted toxin-antitoxin system